MGTINGKIKAGQLGKRPRRLAVDLNEDRQIELLIEAWATLDTSAQTPELSPKPRLSRKEN